MFGNIKNAISLAPLQTRTYMQQCDPSREIRITGVKFSAYDTIRRISARKGIAITKFVSEKLAEIIKTIPKKEKNCEACGELRVRGIGAKTKEEWEALADYYGVNAGAVMKIKLIDAIDAMPDYMKQELPQ